MKKIPELKEKRVPFRRAVLRWYTRNARTLSWRGTRDAYVVWVSEIMLQQTRVDQGTPYIERFLKAFPTHRALAAAKADHVLKLWEGLGYYTRARNLQKAAQFVVGELNGTLPTTSEGWMKLPGVGRYTAGAIASIAFGETAPVLDGNVKRVLARVLDINACIDDAGVTEALWERAGQLVKGTRPGDFNQGMMELGARVCTPRRPACGACVLRGLCAACEAGTQLLRPVRREKKRVPHHEIAVAAIRKNGRYLLGKRPPEGMLGGLWELPGARVEGGESPETALMRELKKDLRITVEVGGLVASVDHAYSHFKVTLNVYACRQTDGRPAPRTHTEVKWVTPSRFKEFAFPGANRKFLHLL